MAETSDILTTVVGCGTGRCGTTTLAQLLQMQGQTLSRHEGMTTIGWTRTDESAAAAIQLWKAYLHESVTMGARFVADVGNYHLNFIPDLIAALPNVRVVAMWRDKVETAMSWDRALGASQFLRKNNTPGRQRFPTLPFADDAYSACLTYWEMYQDEIDRLVNAYPDHVKRFELDAFNSRAGQDTIFDWVGLPQQDRRYPKNCKFNSVW